jgi:uncharacterized protein (DUF1684 family)
MDSTVGMRRLWINPQRGRVRALLCALLTVAAFGCSSGPRPVDDTDAYKKAVEQKRADKEKMFRDANDPDNPIPASRQLELLPLSYYAIDPDYRVPAELKASRDQPVFDMPTSTGKMRKVTQVGTLEFTVKGQPLTLLAFAGEGPGGGPDMRRLFVPFMDLTTGTETYNAGRYLDLDRTATGVYLLDFNAAYNPYCAYNNSYDCPLPPVANRLKMPITAGERMKHPPRADAPRG